MVVKRFVTNTLIAKVARYTQIALQNGGGAAVVKNELFRGLSED